MLLLTALACATASPADNGPAADDTAADSGLAVDSATDDTGDDSGAGTADPSLANCTVRMDRIFSNGTEVYTQDFDSESRLVAYVTNTTYDEGTVSDSEGVYGYDSDGCTTYGWVRFANIDGTTGATTTSDSTTEATCDAHKNPTNQDILLETYSDDGSGNIQEATDEYRVSIENIYDGALWTAAVFARDDGTASWKYTYEYDGSGLLAVRTYFANATSNTAPTWSTTYTHNDHSLVETAVFEHFATGSTSTLYTEYDEFDRAESMRFSLATNGVESYASLTRYIYRDDVWLWPASHTNDIDEDGDTDETASYSYACL